MLTLIHDFHISMLPEERVKWINGVGLRLIAPVERHGDEFVPCSRREAFPLILRTVNCQPAQPKRLY